jgi:hypothetical protein
MPTPVSLLEQGEHMLILRRYNYQQEITPKQDQMWRLLVRYGISPDAPGTITVVCYWGLANVAPREVVVYTPYGPERKVGPKAMTSEELHELLRDWWVDHRRKRR